MIQDSPAAHKNYTLSFYILQKEIAISKLKNYILASIRATLSTWYQVPPETSI